jgi:hypothetical protein
MKAGNYALVNYGGSFQLDIYNANDLEALEIMDEAFWMSTSAPTFGLNCDEELTVLLDRNKNGRILSSDVRDASAKILRVLKNRNGIDKRLDTISIDCFNEEDDEGLQLQSAVKEILNNLDKKPTDILSLKELRDDKAILCDGLTNGDGIIPPDDVEDKVLQKFIQDIILCLGSYDDVNGKAGIGDARLKNFLDLTDKYLSWKDSRDFDPKILPLQQNTADGHAIYMSIKYKIDEYFQLCGLKAFNSTLERQQVEPPSPQNVYHSGNDIDEYLKKSPLATVLSEPVLHLNDKINPLFSSKLESLKVNVLDKFLSPSLSQLTKDDWLKVCDTFKPYEEWLNTKQGIEVKALDDDTLRNYISSDLPSKLQSLIDKDKLLGEKLKVRDELEELLIVQKNIISFCNNYVSFPHLYNPEHRAIFEIGYLVIDGRIFNFNIPVEDIKEHASIAERSGIYLLYLEITGSKEDKTFYICTPVTSRKLGLLGLGKRGILYDLDGKEWDAKVVQVVQNPVSLTEAILGPFRKMTKLLMGAVDKISTGTEKELEKRLNKATTNIQKDVSTGISAPPKSPAKKTNTASTARDLMLTGSVTFAALGSSFAYISSTFAKMDPTKGLAIFAAGMLIIILPIIIVASIKLYQRNISSILEASGWAINARMRLTHQMAKILEPKPDKPGKVFRKKRDLLKNFSSKFKFRKKTKKTDLVKPGSKSA